MLLFVYTTTRKRFVIFTCRYFKLSRNTTALSQSDCRNFSCSSISRETSPCCFTPSFLVTSQLAPGIMKGKRTPTPNQRGKGLKSKGTMPTREEAMKARRIPLVKGMDPKICPKCTRDYYLHDCPEFKRESSRGARAVCEKNKNNPASVCVYGSRKTFGMN